MHALFFGLMLTIQAATPTIEAGNQDCVYSPDVIDTQMVECWADREVAKFVRDGSVTAAGVAVVSDGDVILARSYGWFDPVKQIQITPSDQFLIASVTKSFVGLVIAKLHERGLIRSLDDPANLYLKRYLLSENFDTSVTVAQLATHTAGLESPGFKLSSGKQRHVPATADELNRWLPEIVRPPGTRVVYANYGPPILGALAEDVTGERFDRLLEELVLRPLGMNETTLGYDPSGGARLIYAGITGQDPITYALRTINDPLVAPAGSVQSTPGDMALYLNGLLGHLPTALSEEVLDEQQRPRASNFPGLSQSGLGVFMDNWNDTEVVSHSGLIAGYRSSLQIVPSRDFGVFVVFAGGHDAFSGGPGDARVATDAFLGMVFGPVKPHEANVTTDPSKYTGRYWAEPRAHTTPEALLGAQRLIDVELAPDGGLLIGGPGQSKTRYVEIAPALFEGPVKDGRRPNRYGFEPETILTKTGYGTRVSGFGDPLVLTNLGGILLLLVVTGLARFFGPWRERLTAYACGLAALAIAYALVLPRWTGVIFDVEMFEGIDWRFRLATAASWVLLLAGTAALFLGSRALFALGKAKKSQLANAHLVVIGIASLGLASIGAFFNFL